MPHAPQLSGPVVAPAQYMSVQPAGSCCAQSDLHWGAAASHASKRFVPGMHSRCPRHVPAPFVRVHGCGIWTRSQKPPTASIEVVEQVEARGTSPLEEVLRSERADIIRRAIDQLPPKQRATLMLRVYQECSHEEIAAAIGSTVGAVKANFFHALGNLRRLLRTT